VTDRYAVIGNPIGHTKSPLIHRTFAKQTGEDIAYDALEAPTGGFATSVGSFRRAGGRGLNVTLPFKLDAFAYATQLGRGARLAGAVNALKFEGEAVLGENFDGIGLVNDIIRNLGWPMQGRRVLVLGAGGAVRGLLPPFLAQGPAHLVVANRTVAKAKRLAGEFGALGPIEAVGYGSIEDERPFDLVVNATSASLRGELPPVPAGAFAPGTLAYDLTYGKGLTPFLRLAAGAQARRLVDGVGMLVEQAAEAFAWWRGVRPQTTSVIKELTVPLV